MADAACCGAAGAAVVVGELVLGVAGRSCGRGSGAEVAEASQVLGAELDAGRMLAGSTMSLMPGPQSGTGCRSASVDTATGAKPEVVLSDALVSICSCTSLPFGAVKLAVC